MRRKAEPAFEITHRYIRDPEAFEEAVQLWATLLTRHLRRHLTEQAKKEREHSA